MLVFIQSFPQFSNKILFEDIYGHKFYGQQWPDKFWSQSNDPFLVFNEIATFAAHVCLIFFKILDRIEHIGPLEVHGKYGNLQRKQITLVDNDGVRSNFFLWGEQVLIANLFRYILS